MNAEQALNNKNDLSVKISVDKPDIIILTKVIPKAQCNPVPQALPQLVIPGYNFYVNFDNNVADLGKSGKRGIIIFFSTLLNTKQITFSNSLFEEYPLAEVILPNNVSFTIGGVYRSPSSNKLKVQDYLLISLRKYVIDNRPIYCWWGISTIVTSTGKLSLLVINLKAYQ